MARLLVKVRCPNLRCRAVLSVPADKRGRCVRCEMCGEGFMVPLPTENKPRTRPPEVIEQGTV